MPDKKVLCFPSAADLQDQWKVQKDQLELFDWARIDKVYFCVIDIGCDDGEVLLSVIRQVNVRCILDLRSIPLFGQTIRRHRELFRQLYMRKIRYIDLSFGSSGKNSRAGRWFRSDLRNLIRKAFGSVPVGVCLLLVDQENPAEDSVRRLRNLIASRGSKYIEMHPAVIRSYWNVIYD